MKKPSREMYLKFRRGIELAHWILPGRSVVPEIALGAFWLEEKLDLKRVKRVKYQNWRDRIGRKFSQAVGLKMPRYKMDLSGDQSYQLAVLLEAERFEQAEEQIHSTAVTQEDFVVRFLKKIACRALYHNPFHAAVSMCQVVFDHGEFPNLQAIYQTLHPDDADEKTDTQARNLRKLVLDELRDRFGNRLEYVSGHRGRFEFRRAYPMQSWVPCVEQSLERFAPWDSSCRYCRPERNHEHDSDPARCHTLMVPRCFMKLADECRFGPLWNRLAIPSFAVSGGNSNDEPKGGRWDPPKFRESELWDMLGEFVRKADRDRQVLPTEMSVQVDGKEMRRGDFDPSVRITLHVPEFASLLEIRDENSGVLLAAHLFAEWNTAEGSEVRRFRFRQGRTIEVAVGYLPPETDEESGRYVVEIGFLRTPALERLKDLIALPSFLDSRWATVALGAALAVALYWGSSKLSKTGPIPPLPPAQPFSQPASGSEPTAGITPMVDGTRSVREKPATLASARTVLVTGLGPSASQLEKVVLEALKASDSLKPTDDEALADVWLVVRLERIGNGGQVALRLLNSQNKVLWGDVVPVSGPQPTQAATEAVHLMIRKLVLAHRQAQSQPGPY